MHFLGMLSTSLKVMKVNHASTTPVRELSNHLRVKFLPKSTAVLTPTALASIEEALYSKSNFEYMSITNFLPSDPLKKHRLIEVLTGNGLRFPCVLLTYSSGSNIGNLHFLWKVPDERDPAAVFERSQPVIESVKLVIPQYHTRAMRAALFEKFGRVSPCTKPSALRYFYRELTGDQCSTSTTEQAEVDKRIKQIIDMEDPSILPDLRALNTGHSSKFNVFWEECGKFLNEDVGVAVDDRRHGEITHLAKAISVRDLVDQVKARCPEGTLIPSVEWTRLQFWPKTPAATVHWPIPYEVYGTATAVEAFSY